ncbi:MAG: MXAN_6640 family putative metalloprotease [Nocardioides sp.]
MSVAPSRHTPLLVVVAAVLTALLAAPAAQGDVSPPAVAGSDKAASASTEGSTQRATHALTKVREVLDGGRGDATLALRDLALLKSELTGADRAAAERILARPSDPVGDDEDSYANNAETVICSAVVCVHYVVAGPERTTPAYAQTTLDTVTAVHQFYVGAGYRAPKPDGTKGGDARTDIYIANIGNRGLYGYCTTDENVPFAAPWDRWAYCVVDNDYASNEFPTNTPLENLQVTAAHEYFHAVQFAYDFAEDGWFLEATAAWVEDEVFDDVNDNVQYLRAQSPLKQSRVSMDKFGGLRHYGAWIFFRYLTEKYPAEAGGMPTLVRDMIRKTDGAAGAKDLYSWQAVSSVLKSKKTTASRAFAAFSAANRRPGKSYDEGASQRYPTPPVVDRATVARTVKSELKLDHLASASYRATPAKALSARSWKLRLNVDMQATSRGSSALVTTFFKSGKANVQWVKLNKRGNGTKAVPFSRRKVKYVEITLVNASGRFRCWQSTPFSCSGKPKDDNLLQQITLRPFR